MNDRMNEAELRRRTNHETQTIDLTVAVPLAANETPTGTTLIVLGGFGLTRAVFQNVENWLKSDSQ